jgi:hypothetical protein
LTSAAEPGPWPACWPNAAWRSPRPIRPWLPWRSLTSDSTLRLRGRAELADSLAAAGLVAEEVRDAPDRPGREFVFIARRGVRLKH